MRWRRREMEGADGSFPYFTSRFPPFFTGFHTSIQKLPFTLATSLFHHKSRLLLFSFFFFITFPLLVLFHHCCYLSSKRKKKKRKTCFFCAFDVVFSVLFCFVFFRLVRSSPPFSLFFHLRNRVSLSIYSVKRSERKRSEFNTA